jgi:hypothetical protein
MGNIDHQNTSPTAAGLRSAARAIILEDGGTKRATRLAGEQLAVQLAANFLSYKEEILGPASVGGRLDYGPERRLLEICRSPDRTNSTTRQLFEEALELHV